MTFRIITLFPEMFDCLKYGVIGKAFAQKLINIDIINLRNFAFDKHQTVDDKPYGGGPGMLLKPEPIKRAILAAKKQSRYNSLVIYLSPTGVTLNNTITQDLAFSLSSQQFDIILLCGRYEGIDQRVIDKYIDLELSIGDYVLSGGELPAMVLIDSIVRLIPGVLGSDDSIKQESFGDELLDCPHYTRPKTWEGDNVPEVLLSGNHKLIADWRNSKRITMTRERRQDLFEKYLAKGGKQ